MSLHGAEPLQPAVPRQHQMSVGPGRRTSSYGSVRIKCRRVSRAASTAASCFGAIFGHKTSLKAADRWEGRSGPGMLPRRACGPVNGFGAGLEPWRAGFESEKAEIRAYKLPWTLS